MDPVRRSHLPSSIVGDRSRVYSPFFSLSRKLDYMRITTWAEYGVICAASHECSIRPVWVMLQRRVGLPVLQG